MKSKLLFVCMLIFALLFQTGCSAKLSSAEWEAIIANDFFSDKTMIEKAVSETVSVSAKQKGEKLIVTVEAPYICEELIEWMNSVSEKDFTEAKMEKRILNLLKETEIEEKKYTLDCYTDGEVGEISYTAEFGDGLSCGLTRFYTELTKYILGEMEDEI